MRKLNGLAFGLLGFGQIARAVAVRGKGFGFKMLAHDPGVAPTTIDREGVEPVTFDDLVAHSDILSLHLPLTQETRGIIGFRELARARKGAIVINTARGGLIDDAALLQALQRGHIGGAGIDVLDHEPPKFNDSLRQAPRLVLTPPAAWYSETAIVELRRKTIDAALILLNGGTPNGLVAL